MPKIPDSELPSRPRPRNPFSDFVSLRRVANGFIMEPHAGAPEGQMHVATTPQQLADLVLMWATTQVEVNP